MKRLLLCLAAAGLAGTGCQTPPGDAGEVVTLDPPALPGDPVSIELPPPSPLEPATGMVPSTTQPSLLKGRLPIKGVVTVSHQPAGALQIDAVRAVKLGLDLSQAEGDLRVIVEVEAPNGMPFQRHERVVRARLRETQHLEFALPVAGTLVQEDQLAGKWTARFTVNGKPLTSATFELLP